MTHIFVTGATGFLGSHLIRYLQQEHNYDLSASVRSVSTATLPNGVNAHRVEELGAGTAWKTVLQSVDVVVHCAARVHVMDDTSIDPLAEFRKVNVEGTLRLAREAVEAGVKRFVFISSIKVNGEETLPGAPYMADDTPKPLDPYGVSKMEAERGLMELAEKADMDVVIIRPVLVYGAGVRANVLTMMRWLSRGIPLPLGAVHNRRSLVALDNLSDLIATCVWHPAAANQIFLVSDGEDLSTTDLLRRMALSLGTSARLLPIPVGLLKIGATLIGKSSISQRLCGSLQVDISKTRLLLGWSPCVSVDKGLAVTAQHYLEQTKR